MVTVIGGMVAEELVVYYRTLWCYLKKYIEQLQDLVQKLMIVVLLIQQEKMEKILFLMIQVLLLAVEEVEVMVKVLIIDQMGDQVVVQPDVVDIVEVHQNQVKVIKEEMMFEDQVVVQVEVEQVKQVRIQMIILFEKLVEREYVLQIYLENYMEKIDVLLEVEGEEQEETEQIMVVQGEQVVVVEEVVLTIAQQEKKGLLIVVEVDEEDIIQKVQVQMVVEVDQEQFQSAILKIRIKFI